MLLIYKRSLYRVKSMNFSISDNINFNMVKPLDSSMEENIAAKLAEMNVMEGIIHCFLASTFIPWHVCMHTNSLFLLLLSISLSVSNMLSLTHSNTQRDTNE